MDADRCVHGALLYGDTLFPDVDFGPVATAAAQVLEMLGEIGRRSQTPAHQDPRHGSERCDDFDLRGYAANVRLEVDHVTKRRGHVDRHGENVDARQHGSHVRSVVRRSHGRLQGIVGRLTGFRRIGGAASKSDERLLYAEFLVEREEEACCPGGTATDHSHPFLAPHSA